MDTEAKPDPVAQARAGDEALLQALRACWRGEPSRIRTFEVDKQGIIDDTLFTGPRWRNQVFKKTTPFIEHGSVPREASSRTAVDDIQRCPPLAERFTQLALAHIAEIEARMVTDDTLSRSGQRALRHQLTQFTAAGRSCWENWVWNTPTGAHGQFDRIVSQWWSEPVQLTESEWFIKGWQDVPYALNEAYNFFRVLDPELRLYLGIELGEAKLGSGEIIRVALLRVPPPDANQWAKRAGLPLRFKRDR